MLGSVAIHGPPPCRESTGTGSRARPAHGRLERAALGLGVHPEKLTLHAWSLRFLPVMARKKISTTVYITPEQDERLKLLNDRTKVPVAEYIRQGIDLVLDKYRAALPGQLTLDELDRKG
jgi:hypothetical protein